MRHYKRWIMLNAHLAIMKMVFNQIVAMSHYAAQFSLVSGRINIVKNEWLYWVFPRKRLWVQLDRLSIQTTNNGASFASEGVEEYRAGCGHHRRSTSQTALQTGHWHCQRSQSHSQHWEGTTRTQNGISFSALHLLTTCFLEPSCF